MWELLKENNSTESVDFADVADLPDFAEEDVQMTEIIEEINNEDDSIVVETAEQPQPQKKPIDKEIVFAEPKVLLLELKKSFGENAGHDCGIDHLEIIGSTRNGLETTCRIQCQMCNCIKRVRCLAQDDGTLDINHSAVAATMQTGGGFNQLEDIMLLLNVKYMSKALYLKCHTNVIDGYKKAARQSMIDAGKEERDFAMVAGDVHPINKEIAITTAIAGGSWMKRSYHGGNYNSLSGQAAIVGGHTKKVLCVVVKNKFCVICETAAHKRVAPREHRCYKNWSRQQSSTSMESAAILEGFQPSVQTHRLIYAILVADGDSSVYKCIRDDDPYAEYEVVVIKVECDNHLLRNLCSCLNRISARGPHKELRDIIAKLIYKVRTAIKSAARYRSEQENLSFSDRDKLLKDDLRNVISHVFGEHKKCKDLAYFCKNHSNKNQTNYIPKLRETGLLGQMEAAMQRIIDNSKSLLCRKNNNAVESLNCIMAKYNGGKRINFGRTGSYEGRVYAAVLHYNTKETFSRLCAAMGKEPTASIIKLETKRKRQLDESKKRKEKAKASSFYRTEAPQRCDKDYGPNAEKPDDDMTEEVYNLEHEKLMTKLHRWQVIRQRIEAITRGQANSDTWYFYRKHLLTASNFGKVCKLRDSTNRAGTIITTMYPQILKVAAVEYGKENEKIALEELAAELGVPIKPCGLFIDYDIPYLGATPDGLINDDTIVEIKCPYSAKDMSADDALENISCLRGMIINDQMNRTHDYYYQVQGQLHATNRQYAYFCFWTPHSRKTVRVERDDTFWATKMADKLETFYKDHMAPELITRRVKKEHDRKKRLRRRVQHSTHEELFNK
ncbi:uncharacterized protein LOC143218255 [Lasioglossum baleicum]|uniref:uncharacterized protein LOC143218255 n=1 Tax=Lasioglossum baleicum TaxID=434251 RepID=UPI003FCE6633